MTHFAQTKEKIDEIMKKHHPNIPYDIQTDVYSGSWYMAGFPICAVKEQSKDAVQAIANSESTTIEVHPVWFNSDVESYTVEMKP